MKLAAKQRQSQNLFELSANRVPVGLYIVQDGVFCYTNSVFQSTTGYSEDELLGKDPLELVVPADREMVRENAIKMLKGKLTSPYRFRVTHKDGSTKWIMESVVPIQHSGRQATLGYATDITDYKQTEGTLKVEKNKLQSLIDAMTDSLVMQDKEYNIVYQNEGSKKIYGDHVGEKCYRVFEGRNKVCEGCPVEQAFKDGKPHKSERKTVLTLGETVIWENTAHPIRDADGRITTCLEVGRNITERKRAEEALQNEKNKLEALIDAMNDALNIIDRDYTILYQNKPSKKPVGDHVGEKCYRVFEGRNKVCDGCPVEQAFKDGKSHTAERMIVISGEVTFWENTANPIRDAQGRIVACLEIARDITERKKMEEAQRQSEEKYRALFDNTLVGMVVIDVETMKVTMANQAAANIFRFSSAKEAIGVNPLDFISPEYRERAFEIIANIANDMFELDLRRAEEFRMITKDGREIWLSAVGARILHEGRLAALVFFTDITARKKQEQSLADELTRHRILVDQSLDGIVVLDEDARVVEANQRFAEMLGYTPEEVRKLHTWDWDKNFPPDKILEMGRSVDEKGLRLETKHTRKDGSVIDVDISISAAMFAGQKLIFCVCRDVTAHKQAEKALKESEERYKELANSITDVFFAMDKHLKYTYWNKASEVLTGIRSEDAIGKSLLEVFPDIPEMRREKIYHKVLWTQQPETFENEFDINSRHYAFEISVYPSKDGIAVIAKDITGRKKIEEALNLQRAYFQQLFDNSPDAIIMLGTDATVIQSNRGFERFFGYSPEEIKGLHIKKLIVPEDRLYEVDDLIQAISEKKVFRKETVRRHKHGNLIDVSILSYPIIFDSKVVAACTMYTNITDRKRIQEALQAEKNKLQSLIDAMEDDLTIQDREYNIIFQNEPSKRSAGGDHRGEKCYRAYEGQEEVCEGCPVEQAFKDGKSHTVERMRVISGQVTFWEITANPIRDAQGRIAACLEIGRNITERKKQEQALADEATRRRILVDQSLDGIVVLDEGARVVEANQRFAEMLGYTPEEVRKLHTWDWDKNFPPDKILEMGRSVDEKGLRLETKHTRKDGSVIDVDISISAAMFGGQKLIFCICRDITERNKMEEALRESREQLKNMFESVNDGISVIDLNGVITEVNQSMVNMHGYDSKDELIGKSALELIEPRDREKVAEHIKKVLILGLRESFECNMLRANGTGFPGELSTSAIRDASGRLIGHVSICRDITERKKMEQALRVAAQQWKETFDSITDAVSIHDRECRIQLANKAFSALLHIEPSQVIGKYCYELHRGTKPISGCPHLQTLRTKKPAAAEFYESHLEKYLLESTSPIFDKEGEVVGTVHITRDVTAQKQQSQRLMMADRLASLGELAAGTAHELNNPLTSIIGFAQLLKDKTIPDDIREDVEFIYSEAQRAANVTKNLLTFARKHTPVKQLTQINSIVEDVLKLRAYELKVNDIEVKKQLAPDLPEIMVDYFQMQQVFLNIIINAEYFMIEAHNRGTLTITTKKENDNIVISIADDGPGIPEEDMRRLFDPFFTTKPAGKGTGLGLSICHGIVAEHGGRIYAKSKFGKGATFIIELPISSA